MKIEIDDKVAGAILRMASQAGSTPSQILGGLIQQTRTAAAGSAGTPAAGNPLKLEDLAKLEKEDLAEQIAEGAAPGDVAANARTNPLSVMLRRWASGELAEKKQAAVRGRAQTKG